MSDKGENKCGFYSLFVFLAFVATSPVLVSCTPKTRTVEGSVFIVTSGRDNIKLGNVEVTFHSDNEIDQFLGEFLPKMTLVLTALKGADEKAYDEMKGLESKKSVLEASVKATTASLKEKRKVIDIPAPQDLEDNKLVNLLKEKEELEIGISEASDKIKYYNTDFTEEMDKVVYKLSSLEKLEFKEQSKLRAFNDPVPVIPEIPILRNQLADMNQEKKNNIRSLTEKKGSDSEKLRQLNIFIGKRQKEFSVAQRNQEQIRLEFERKRNEIAKDIADSESNLEKQNNELKKLSTSLNEAKDAWLALYHRLTEFNEYFKGSTIKDLPSSALVTKTDADGKYSIEIPYDGKFTLSAHAERVVTSELTERYYWLIHLPERDRTKDKLFGYFFNPFKPIVSEKFNLTGDNQIGSEDEHCAVKLLQKDSDFPRLEPIK